MIAFKGLSFGTGNYQGIERFDPVHVEAFSSGDWVGPRTFHSDPVTDFQKASAETAWFKARSSAHAIEIFVILEEKFLCFSPNSQRTAPPVFHGPNDDRQPQSVISDIFFGDCLLSLLSYCSFHLFFFPGNHSDLSEPVC